MEGGIIYLGGEMIVSALSYGLVSVAISDTSHSILNILKGAVFDSDEYPGLTKFLAKLDIKNTIKITETIINDISEKLQKINSVHLGLESVLEIIKKIKQEFDNIEKEIDYHKKERYWADYRTPHYYSYLKQIEELQKILNIRVKLLIDILKLQK